jgi:hypothetical protein
MTREMYQNAIIAKDERQDALVRVLRDVMGFADTSDVAYLWSRKGEQAPYHAAMNEARVMLMQLERERAASNWRSEASR